MHKTFINLTIMFILLIGSSSSAQWAGCPDDAQFLKEIDVDTKTWKDLYRLFKNSPCEDGIYGEGYSDYVAQSLAKHWNRLSELSSLIQKDPLFEDFVLRHIDATDDEKDIEILLNNARKHCPAAQSALCKKIEKVALSVLKELEQYN